MRILIGVLTLIAVFGSLPSHAASAISPIATSISAREPAVLSPGDLYVGALRRLESIPQEPYISYVMSHSQTHQGKSIGGYTLAVVERRIDRRSWNKTTDGTTGKIGTVSIGRHYLIPDAFLPYRNDDVPQGVLPELDTKQQTALHTIADVHSALSYKVTLVGEEILNDCGPVAHLSLIARREPQRYNVREMWVRRSDFRLCKAVFASRLYKDEGEASSYPSIDTVELDVNGLITSYSLFVQVHYLLGTYAVTDEGTFTHIAWASDEPAYLFDYAAWKAFGGAYDDASKH